MTNSSFHLYQLQKNDQKLDSLNKRLSEIDRIRKDNTVRNELERPLLSSKAKLEQLQQIYDELLEKINSKKMKVEQSEASLYSGSIKNPKELQDLQNEIRSLRAAIATLEDAQLQQMLDLESIQKEMNAAQTSVDVFDEKNKLDFSAYHLEESEKKIEIERISQERKLIVDQVDAANLEKYNSLRKLKNGVAVSMIEDCCCGVCGTTLSPSDCQIAKSPTKMAYCPSCGRILYAG